MKAFCIHTVQGRNARGEKITDVAGSVIELSKEDFRRLEKENAVRKPTDDEVVLAAAKAKGKSVEADDEDEGPSAAELNEAAAAAAAESVESVKPGKGKGKTKAAADDL